MFITDQDYKVVIGDNALLDAHNGLTMGKNVNLSSNVVIYTGQHDHRDPYFRSKGGKRSVEIGDRAWLDNVTSGYYQKYYEEMYKGR